MKKNRFLFVAMLFAALTWGFASCDNDNDNEPDDVTTSPVVETPVVPKKINKELYFSQYDAVQISFDTLNKYLAILNEDGSFVFDTIFMIPQGSFAAPSSVGYHYFELARSNLLEPRTNLSPRIRGKGDFVTNPGHPSQAPEDSLWFVSKGWTVNKRFTR